MKEQSGIVLEYFQRVVYAYTHESMELSHMANYEALQLKIQEQLIKALMYLEYSYNKVQKLSDKQEDLDPELLETWESFTARFSRVADLYLAKYVRYCILVDDPGFRGTFRDFMNRAERIELIDDVEAWMRVRALRYLSEHEYAEEDLTEYFRSLLAHTPKLLSIKQHFEQSDS